MPKVLGTVKLPSVKQNIEPEIPDTSPTNTEDIYKNESLGQQATRYGAQALARTTETAVGLPGTVLNAPRDIGKSLEEAVNPRTEESKREREIYERNRPFIVSEPIFNVNRLYDVINQLPRVSGVRKKTTELASKHIKPGYLEPQGKTEKWFNMLYSDVLPTAITAYYTGGASSFLPILAKSAVQNTAIQQAEEAGFGP